VTNPPELQEALNRTQRWYEQTKNPLYVWEAIAWCLHADEQRSLPDWCLAYLRDTAANLHSLACGVDFRDPAKKITSDQAFKLTSNALSLARQGKKNAFASQRRDGDNMRAALDKHYHGRDSEVAKIKQNSTIARRIALGNRLHGFKRKTSP
jgi:hypothetical protein